MGDADKPPLNASWMKRNERPIWATVYVALMLLLVSGFGHDLESGKLHNASLFGLGSFGWLIVSAEVVLAALACAIAVLASRRSIRAGQAWFFVGLIFEQASFQVVRVRNGEVGLDGQFLFWLLTVIGVGLIVLLVPRRMKRIWLAR